MGLCKERHFLATPQAERWLTYEYSTGGFNDRSFYSSCAYGALYCMLKELFGIHGSGGRPQCVFG